MTDTLSTDALSEVKTILREFRLACENRGIAAGKWVYGGPTPTISQFDLDAAESAVFAAFEKAYTAHETAEVAFERLIREAGAEFAEVTPDE